MSWKDDQEFERKWWGTCQNTYGEETKQLVYAKFMSLHPSHDGNSPYSFDMEGKTILDIGGGPSSLLLKCRNVIGMVADPCEYPRWVQQRYSDAKISYHQLAGEYTGLNGDIFDEVWIYNVLQHTQDPKQIIENARRLAPVLRLFEWINIPSHEGHPHMLTSEKLTEWTGSRGLVGKLDGQGTCYGEFYAGMFKK